MALDPCLPVLLLLGKTKGLRIQKQQMDVKTDFYNCQVKKKRRNF
jgi:hypothetical protein